MITKLGTAPWNAAEHYHHMAEQRVSTIFVQSTILMQRLLDKLGLTERNLIGDLELYWWGGEEEEGRVT